MNKNNSYNILLDFKSMNSICIANTNKMETYHLILATHNAYFPASFIFIFEEIVY